MEYAERRRLLDRIVDAVGDDAFNRLVGSLDEVRKHQRLRFWQEDLLRRASVSISTVTDFLDLFAGAEWRRKGRSAEHGNLQMFFELGCCYATAGDLAAANAPLREAILRFK